ncbi:hypothetical protein [Actinokineospora sp. HUAS TT18]|uniref:hypothetical protein n=1 Tax=Actinokineospora sp. HUAS TT18 TaxID=3447451 RepID=UPI003F5228DE
MSATTFGAGDRILIKRGTSCAGTLAPKGSGTATARISVDAYGTGAKPLIAGGGAPRAVLLSGQQGWEIRNLEITNRGATVGDRRAVSIEARDSGRLAHFVLENLDIHDVNGTDSKDIVPGSGGIFFPVSGTTTRSWARGHRHPEQHGAVARPRGHLHGGLPPPRRRHDLLKRRQRSPRRTRS